jgi:hypothetical protein
MRHFAMRSCTAISILVVSIWALRAFAAHSRFQTVSGRSSSQKADLGEGPRIKTDVVACKDSDNWLSYSELATILDGKQTRLSCRGPQNGELRTLVGMPDALAAFTTVDDSGHSIYPYGSSTENWFWAPQTA